MKHFVLLLVFVICCSALLAQAINAIRPAYDLQYPGTTLKLPDGGSLVAWLSSVEGDRDIYLQRLSSLGTPLWDEPCAVIIAPEHQALREMHLCSTGNYLVTWSDGPGIWGQMISPQGIRLWPDSGVLLHEGYCNILPNEQGGIYLAYRSPNNEGIVKGRSLGAMHEDLWQPTERNLAYEDMPIQSLQILPVTTGGFILHYEITFEDGSKQSIMRRIAHHGGPYYADPLLVPNEFPTCVYRMQNLNNGQYLLYSNTNTHPDTLRMLKMDAEGNLLLPTAQTLLLPTWDGQPGTLYTQCNFVPLSDGGMMLYWGYLYGQHGTQYRLTRLGANLQPLWDPEGITITPLYPFMDGWLNICEGENLSLYCTWLEAASGVGRRIRAQKLNSGGIALWPEGGVLLDDRNESLSAISSWFSTQRLNCVWFSQQESQDMLKLQSLNTNGIPIHAAGGLPFVSQLGGYCDNPFIQKQGQGFFCIWQDYRPENHGLYFQICDALLNPMLQEHGRCLLPPSDEYPRVRQVYVSGNNVAVLYSYSSHSDYSNYYLQLVNSMGDVLLPDYGYFLGQIIGNPVLDFVDDEIYMAWGQSGPEPNTRYVKAQKFVNGLPVWESGGKSIASTSAYISNIMLKNRFFCWEESFNNISKVCARRVDANGYIIPSWGNIPLQVIEPYADDRCGSIQADGENLIVFIKRNLNPGGEIYAQKISPDGERLWSAGGIMLDANLGTMAISNHNLADPYTLCYRSALPTPRVHVQKLDSAGNRLFGTDGASFIQEGHFISEPWLYRNPNGWYSLIYEVDNLSGTDSDIFYGMISPAGIPSADGIHVFCAERLNQHELNICGSGNRAFATWLDLRYGLYNEHMMGRSVYVGSLFSLPDDIEDVEIPPAMASSVYSYPNPFSGSATFGYILPEKEIFAIDIYNLKGQKVKTIISKIPAAAGELIWDGCDDHGKTLPAGLYLYKLQGGKSHLSGKLIKL